MVNVAPDNQTPLVTNGYSDLLELYGPEAGMHARSSIGMALPLGAPVRCEAEARDRLLLTRSRETTPAPASARKAAASGEAPTATASDEARVR
jgi:hypothetical protein